MIKENESEDDLDNEDEEESNNIKPSFDFLKMDIFNTDMKKNKRERINFNKKCIKKIKRKIMRLKKIKKNRNIINSIIK